MQTLYENGNALLLKSNVFNNEQIYRHFHGSSLGDDDFWISGLYHDLGRLSYQLEFGRNTTWLGTKGLNYRYAGRDHIAQGWTASTKKLTRLLCLALKDQKWTLNHLLVNQYRQGQSLNMHKDDEPELIGPIVSLSVGDTATFDYTAGQTDLYDGDLLIGNREFFNQFPHSVSPTHRGRIRYNLTWRTIKNETRFKES